MAKENDTALVREVIKSAFEEMKKLGKITEIDTDSALVLIQDVANEVFREKGMTFEESLRNVNKVGKQSIILELDPKWSQFLEAITGADATGTVLDVLMVLNGDSEDYFITGDNDSSHDIEQLEKLCTDNDLMVTQAELTDILDAFKPFLRKRVITWG